MPPRTETGTPGVPTLVAVRRARDVIDRRFAEPLDLAEMAAAAGYSLHHFARAFRAAYSEPPATYLTRRRVERAMDLLRRPEPSITEVCVRVGFASLGSFSARFRELVGESPSAFRARHVHIGPPPVPACFLREWSRPSSSEKRDGPAAP